ncbi:MAG: TolC family protein, partial [Paludibacteraceae bacterium]|nr:TolC family protein [Paludibacteraceae bacterium]
EKNLQYNKLMRRLTLGESLPHLAIGASGGYTNLFEKHNGNVIAFLNLSVPITGWGETSHKLRQHDWQIKQAEWLREDYRAKLDLQNRQIFDRLTESIQLLEEHRASRELARENHRIALMNYQAGVGTMTELMEAETLLLQAENALTDAHISYLTALRKFRDFNK